METRKTPKSQSNLEKYATREINLPDFRLYYKATVIRRVRYQHRNRNTDQWNKTESPEINPHTSEHLIFDKGGKIIQRRKEPYNKWCWENWRATCKRMKPEHFLTLHTKINSKWIKVLNPFRNYKALRGKHRQYTFDIHPSKIFFDPPPKIMY